MRNTPKARLAHYDSLRNARQQVDIKVRYSIRAVEGRIEFSIEIENPTELPLAEVFYGVVGGQNGLVNRHDTESLVPGLFTNLSPDLFRDFSGGSYGGGNLGIPYSAQGFIYTGFGMTMGWTEFYNSKANVGLYYANHDPEPRLSAIYFELRPFTKTAVIGDSWPTRADVPEGEPIGLTMGWLKFPYVTKGHFLLGAGRLAGTRRATGTRAASCTASGMTSTFMCADR